MDRVHPELPREMAMGRLGLGDHEDAARALVEAVDESRPGPLLVAGRDRIPTLAPADVIHERVQQGARPVAGRRMHHEPRRLVDDQQHRVFVKDLDRNGLGRDRQRLAHGNVARDDIARADALRGLRAAAIDGDETPLDQPLRARAREIGVLGGHEDVEPPRGLLGGDHRHPLHRAHHNRASAALGPPFITRDPAPASGAGSSWVSHFAAVRLAELALARAFGRGWDVRAHGPIALDDASEPEPDVTVVRGSPRDYVDAHPAEPVLVVEVALGSLGFDREHKSSLYARAGRPGVLDRQPARARARGAPGSRALAIGALRVGLPRGRGAWGARQRASTRRAWRAHRRRRSAAVAPAASGSRFPRSALSVDTAPGSRIIGPLFGPLSHVHTRVTSSRARRIRR